MIEADVKLDIRINEGGKGVFKALRVQINQVEGGIKRQTLAS